MDPPRKGSLLVIFLTVFIDLLGFGMVLPLLPIYANHFTVDKSGWQIGALMASFSAMQFVFAPLWGRLSDRIGRRPVLMIGLFASVVFYTLFGVATMAKSLPLLFVARIGAGIAGATISTAQAYIADTTTLEKRQKGMALIGMAFGLGFTVGPLFGFLAVLSGKGEPVPWPGFAASILSGIAFLLAVFMLPESLRPDSESAGRKLLDLTSLRDALATPSIGAILIAIFVSIFSFANFETTLSLLINGEEIAAEESNSKAESPERAEPTQKSKADKAQHVGDINSPFHFELFQVCLTYAFIGLMLAIVQGGIVRRLSGKVSEGNISILGVLLEIVGFGLMMATIETQSVTLLYVSLAVVVSGFAFMSPSLNSLLSRRSDPAKQGGILGVGQSTSALARIVGAGLGIPLLKQQVWLPLKLPYLVAACLMVLALFLVIAAVRGGKDYAASRVAG